MRSEDWSTKCLTDRSDDVSREGKPRDTATDRVREQYTRPAAPDGRDKLMSPRAHRGREMVSTQRKADRDRERRKEEPEVRPIAQDYWFKLAAASEQRQPISSPRGRRAHQADTRSPEMRQLIGRVAVISPRKPPEHAGDKTDKQTNRTE